MSGVEAVGRRGFLSLFSVDSEGDGDSFSRVDSNLLLKKGKDVAKLSLRGRKLPGYSGIWRNS